MRQALGVALAATIVVGPVCRVAASAAPLCQSTAIHAGALSVTMNEGDSSVVTVTGYKPDKPKAAPSPRVVHVTAGDSYTVTHNASHMTTVNVPPEFTGQITIDAASPSPNPRPTASATPSPTPTPGSGVHPGGPDDKLTATIKDERYASFTASPAPSPSPSAAGTDGQDGAAPSVTYTIKGEHPGDTKLIVAQGTECVAVAVHVRPSIAYDNRILISAGVGASQVANYAISTQPSAATFSPGVATGSANRVIRTENSGHSVSIPLLFNYRLTDQAKGNVYGTVGLFTNPGTSGGLVYGLSVGLEQFLLTVGLHSTTVNDLAPGLHNNDVVPTGITTSVSRRVTAGFIALTIPTKYLSQLLSPLTGTSSNTTSKSSNSTASSSTSGSGSATTSNGAGNSGN